jgi:small subunit ribosomal protein S2e
MSTEEVNTGEQQVNVEEQQPEQRGGFGRGGRGGRGGKGGRPMRPKQEEPWRPVTNLGRLVAKGLVTSLSEVYYHAIPIKESEIVDKLLQIENKSLKEECVKVKSVQKQTKAGQKTRMKCVIVVGDSDGHIGVGSKLAKEVQLAMKGALLAAKMNLIPVRRGYWGNKIGNPHTLPTKITGKCGSCRMRFIPAPKGTRIVGAPITKKIMALAGVSDIFSASKGNSDTTENYVRAVYDALYKSYCYLTPDLWYNFELKENIFSQHSAELLKVEQY